MKQRSSSFNIIDALIILLVVAIIGVGGYLLFFRSASNDKVTIDYEVEIGLVLSDFDGLIKVGDTVISTVAKDVLGTVVDVEYSPAEFITTNTESGEKTSTPYPEGTYSKVRLTIRTEADYKDNVYYAGAVKIYFGSTIYFRVPNFVGGGVCLGAKPV